MEKYVLQPSVSQPNGWVLTDTENGIVCLFKEGYFNSTQKYTVLEDVPLPDAGELAGIVSRMSEWLLENHRSKLMVRASIARRLEELRKMRGLRQEDVALLTGFKQQNIARIEHAEYSTGIDIIGQLCDALSCHIEIVPNEE
jgi:DNA-binding XRE family transcriptional regulator